MGKRDIVFSRESIEDWEARHPHVEEIPWDGPVDSPPPSPRDEGGRSVTRTRTSTGPEYQMYRALRRGGGR